MLLKHARVASQLSGTFRFGDLQELSGKNNMEKPDKRQQLLNLIKMIEEQWRATASLIVGTVQKHTPSSSF